MSFCNSEDGEVAVISGRVGRPPRDDEAARLLGREIARARERVNKSQSDISRECGFGTGVMSQYEQGFRSPSYSNLVRIARAVGIYPSVLISRALDKYHPPQLPPIELKKYPRWRPKKKTTETETDSDE